MDSSLVLPVLFLVMHTRTVISIQKGFFNHFNPAETPENFTMKMTLQQHKVQILVPVWRAFAQISSEVKNADDMYLAINEEEELSAADGGKVD